MKSKLWTRGSSKDCKEDTEKIYRRQKIVAGTLHTVLQKTKGYIFISLSLWKMCKTVWEMCKTRKLFFSTHNQNKILFRDADIRAQIKFVFLEPAVFPQKSDKYLHSTKTSDKHSFGDWRLNGSCAAGGEVFTSTVMAFLNPTLSSHPQSSLSCVLRFFGVSRV